MCWRRPTQESPPKISSPSHNPTVLRADPHTPVFTFCGPGTPVTSQAAAFLPWVLVLPLQSWKVVVHPHLANSIHSFSPVPSSLSLLLLQLDLILPVFSSNFSCYQCLVTSLPAGVVNDFHEGTKPRLPPTKLSTSSVWVCLTFSGTDRTPWSCNAQASWQCLWLQLSKLVSLTVIFQEHFCITSNVLS